MLWTFTAKDSINPSLMVKKFSEYMWFHTCASLSETSRIVPGLEGKCSCPCVRRRAINMVPTINALRWTNGCLSHLTAARLKRATGSPHKRLLTSLPISLKCHLLYHLSIIQFPFLLSHLKNSPRFFYPTRRTFFVSKLLQPLHILKNKFKKKGTKM